MDKTCTICFDEMDMNSYQDEHVSTSTCFKLECNHAFHTKCIVECLQKTKHKCPSCNEDKNLEQTLTKEGVILELVDNIKKAEPVSLSLREFRESKRELDASIKLFKYDVQEYANKKKLEMNLLSKFNYYKKCKSNALQTAKQTAKQMGGKYRAAITSNYSNSVSMQILFEKTLFGGHSRRYDYYYKNLHMRITI